VIYGCRDPEALNYNPSATHSDGSCTYPPPPKVRGCTDPFAINYNSAAEEDDGSCILPDVAIDYTFYGLQLPEFKVGFNGARAFLRRLKSGTEYWFENNEVMASIGMSVADLLRNGGTSTMGQRHIGVGNGYAASVGQWPACFSQERRLQIGTPPDLSRYITDAELKADLQETDNQFDLFAAALEATATSAVLVVNPYMDAAEVDDLINFIGSSRIAVVVAGNELNSPKATELGIEPEDVVYWARTLKPIVAAHGLPLAVGVPPYEYRFRELNGESLNSKLQRDKRFFEHLAAAQAHEDLFDAICFHPYRQVPDRLETESREDYLVRFEASWGPDYDFVQVQLNHIRNAFPGLMYLPDEHGIEKPEFGHMGTKTSMFWVAERTLNLATMPDVYGSCFQVLLGKGNPDGTFNAFIKPGTDGFELSPEMGVFEVLEPIADATRLSSFLLNDNYGIYAFILGDGRSAVAWWNKGPEMLTNVKLNNTTHIVLELGEGVLDLAAIHLTIPAASIGVIVGQPN
jgi:hypothetical protein